MAIIYNPNKKIFTLHTAHTTYQMQVDPLGYLLHLYYGEKTNSSMDYVLTYADRGFSGNPYVTIPSRARSKAISSPYGASSYTLKPRLTP